MDQAPTPARPFLTAEWRHLLLVQFEADPALLDPLVPGGTELDLWQGKALLSLVGFRFLDTRLLGVPIPFHRDFDEVNLRFYVRRRTLEGWRRGVVFVREVVPRHALALVAKLCYNEPYVALPLRHSVQMAEADTGGVGRVRYEWRHRGGWLGLGGASRGRSEPATEGSEAEFVTEHYWGYTTQRDGGTLEYQVRHPPWRLWRAGEVRFEGDAAAMYGPGFGSVLGTRAVSGFIADGSAVTVQAGRRLPT